MEPRTLLGRSLPFVLVSLMGTTPALAAQVTDVADAVEVDDPFDAHVGVTFEFMRHSALITRENTQVSVKDTTGTARNLDVRELDYERYRTRVRPRLEVGLFHDVAVFLDWPIVLWDQQSTRFTSGTNNTNSTITRDMLSSPTVEGWNQTCGNGLNGVDANECYGTPAGGYTDWTRLDRDTGAYQSVRAGFDYPELGLRWSPVNNERDPSKPTITLQADYNLGFLPLPPANPTPPERVPTGDAATASDPGAVARGLHEFHFQVAMSKRWQLLDPFFVVDYWLPFAASDAVGGLFPRHRGGFLLGMEIVPHENLALSQRFAVQLSGLVQYHSEGRDYSEISDLLGELTYTDNFMRAGVNAGLYFQPMEFGYFQLTGSAHYDSPHLLTTEKIGTDNDAPGTAGAGVVNLDVRDANGQPLGTADIERNPYFNPAMDTPGRRFKVDESLRLQVMARAVLTF
ncbi:MAG: hypothetical protein ACO3JL_08490 [Myxococcota bacterium]